MEEGWWHKEEFEELIQKGLLAMYENMPAKKLKRLLRQIVPWNRVSSEEINFIRSVGAYFSPSDRVSYASFIDKENDGIPEYGSCAHSNKTFRKNVIEGYVDVVVARRIRRFPGEVQTSHRGIPYVVIHYTPVSDGGYVALKDYATLGEDGTLYPCKTLIPKNGGFGNDWQYFFTIDDEAGKDELPKAHILCSLALGFYADRKFLWNVVASEGHAKATFGIYEEQIKSLFYARSLPMTETGRRRPILHWVAAHRRRIKEGIDIDIEKHLRGIDSFEMNGTKFDIVNPRKHSP